MKKKRQTYPVGIYKSRETYLLAKINQFNAALAACGKVWKGSAYLPKSVRDDLDGARKCLYNSASMMIGWAYANGHIKNKKSRKP